MMTTDYDDGKKEVLRDIARAKANLESLLLRAVVPDRERLAWGVVLLGTTLSYLESDDEEQSVV